MTRTTALCFFRLPGTDIRSALLAAITRANRLLVSRFRKG